MIAVSVIIPVYNSSAFLHRCIGSLLAQTDSSCEYIFVNDGSTDDSRDIILSYKEKDSRILLIDQENQGVSGARNTGIDNATGKYIAFVDADDSVAPGYFETLLATMQKYRADLAICGYKGHEERFLPEGEILLEKSDEPKILQLFESYLIHNVYCKLYLRDIISREKLYYDVSFNYGEDFLFNLEYIKHVRKIGTTPGILYFYDVSVPGSLSKQYHIGRFMAVELQNRATEATFRRLGLASAAAKKYLDTLYYWNAYDSVHNLFAGIGSMSKAEANHAIKTILGFQYFNSDIRTAERPTLLLRIFKLRKPELIRRLFRAYRSLRR